MNWCRAHLTGILGGGVTETGSDVQGRKQQVENIWHYEFRILMQNMARVASVRVERESTEEEEEEEYES